MLRDVHSCTYWVRPSKDSKTQHSKCRLFWRLIEFIDGRQSVCQSVGILDPSFELFAILPWIPSLWPPPLSKVNILWCWLHVVRICRHCISVYLYMGGPVVLVTCRPYMSSLYICYQTKYLNIWFGNRYKMTTYTETCNQHHNTVYTDSVWLWEGGCWVVL